MNVHQCQILYLQVQIRNYIHTTLVCLFKPCMCLSLFQKIMSDSWIFYFCLGKVFSMGLIGDIIQCNFIFVSFLSNRFSHSFKRKKKAYYCVKREIFDFFFLREPNSFMSFGSWAGRNKLQVSFFPRNIFFFHLGMLFGKPWTEDEPYLFVSLL